jgi:hypothetical protein
VRCEGEVGVAFIAAGGVGTTRACSRVRPMAAPLLTFGRHGMVT